MSTTDEVLAVTPPSSRRFQTRLAYVKPVSGPGFSQTIRCYWSCAPYY